MEGLAKKLSTFHRSVLDTPPKDAEVALLPAAPVRCLQLTCTKTGSQHCPPAAGLEQQWPLQSRAVVNICCW